MITNITIIPDNVKYLPCTCKKISKENELYMVDIDLQVNKYPNLINKIILSMIIDRTYLLFDYETLKAEVQTGFVAVSVHKDLPDDYTKILIFPDLVHSMCSIYSEDLNILLNEGDFDAYILDARGL